MTLTSGRTPVEYLPRGKFIAPSAADNESAARNYGRQYASLYWYRLESIKPHLLLAAQQRWSSSQEGIAILLCTITLPSKITLHKDAVYVDRLLDIKAGELCFVIGTVYMDMPMKPNVLERLEQDLEIAVPPISESKYCSAEDSVCLEDHTGRIQLTGQPLLPTADSLLVTGMPVAVLGRESEQGAFEVLDFCLSGMAPPFPLPQPVDSGDRFILLLSGLELNERSDTFQLQLLADLINGMLTVDASQIVRVILAGNSLAVEAVDCTINDDIQMPVDPLLLLDNFVEQLAASVPVDLMPGLTDPAGYVWPQQPIHKALLPHSGRLTNLTSQTNPCQFSVDGIEFLGTSGQNISDICRYANDVDPLLAASQTILCRHVAPTAPDTLPCYPFSSSDPFIIDQHSPNVYFIGNQDRFDSKLLSGKTNGNAVRIILVPSFARTNSAALVNLRTLECFPLTIQ